MSIRPILFAFCLLLALVGCGGGELGGSEPGGDTGGQGGGGGGGSGGAGGIGGNGGGGAGGGGTGGAGGAPPVGPCVDYCEALAGCDMVSDVEACAAQCEQAWAGPEELLRECSACMAATACSEWDGACQGACTDGLDLVLVAEGFEEYVGKRFHLYIELDTGEMLVDDSWVIGDRFPADFELPLYGYLAPGDGVVVSHFVDVDEDGLCGEGDLAGHRAFPATREHLQVEFSGSAEPDLRACPVFTGLPADLQVTGAGFSAFHGRSFHFVLLDADGAEVARDGWEVGAAGGDDFAVTRRGALLVGESYELHYFVDSDGDSLCGSGDHAASLAIPAVTGHTTVELGPGDPVDGAACAHLGWSPKHLTLQGAGFAGSEGALVAATARRQLAGRTIDLSTLEATVEQGAFELLFRELLRDDTSYTVEWFVDLDGDGLCTGADLGGTIGGLHAPYADPRFRVVGPGDSTGPDCSAFAGLQPGVLLRGSAFGSFDGRRYEAYLIDRDAPAAFAAYRSGTIRDGAFEALLTPAASVGDYELLWMVDDDGNAQCNLPEDLAARVVVGTLAGRATVNVTPAAPPDADACSEMNAFWD